MNIKSLKERIEILTAARDRYSSFADTEYSYWDGLLKDNKDEINLIRLVEKYNLDLDKIFNALYTVYENEKFENRIDEMEKTELLASLVDENVWYVYEDLECFAGGCVLYLRRRDLPEWFDKIGENEDIETWGLKVELDGHVYTSECYRQHQPFYKDGEYVGDIYGGSSYSRARINFAGAVLLDTEGKPLPTYSLKDMVAIENGTKHFFEWDEEKKLWCNED